MTSTERYTQLRGRVHDLLGRACQICGTTQNRLWIDRVEGHNGAKGLALYYAVLRNPGAFRLLCVHHKLTKQPPQKDNFGWPRWDPFHGEQL